MLSEGKSDMEISNKSAVSPKESDDACRVCLSSKNDNKCIFSFPMTFNRHDAPDLWKKLQFYGGIEVKHGDGLPSKMCDKCIGDLRHVHEFRTRCQETDKKLRSSSERGSDENNADSSRDAGQGEFKRSDGPDISQNCAAFCEKAIDAKKIVGKRTLIERGTGRTRGRTTSRESSLENLGEAWKIPTKLSPVFLNDERTKMVARKSETKESFAENPTDDFRPKRSIVFRRITSMECLKNRKERQRRYVKKAAYGRIKRKDVKVSEIDEICAASSRKSESDLGILRHECTKCHRSYKREKLSKAHESSHVSHKFSCDQCDERFARLVEFLEHSRSHDSRRKFEAASCKICKKKFRKASTMVRHLHVHKRENPRAVCAILKKMRDERKVEKSPNVDGLWSASNKPDESHSPFEERDAKKMTRVDSKTEEFFDVSSTSEISTGPEIPSDDGSAIKLINMWIREELDSENDGKVFPCGVCKKSYVSEKSLLKHIAKIHHESCGVCEESCTCADKVEKIVRKNTEETTLHRCRECEKTFEKETKLEKHMKIHTRDKASDGKDFKRFLCHICSKTFRQNTGLMFHMRTHTGYKPHVCRYCGRGFTSNSNCTNHERTHTGDRPFVCHFCSAAFAKSCTLKAHITTHTGEANYHCKTCGKSFRRLKYLKEHRFTHTGEKPFVCKMCGTAYSHSGSLFVHEKKCKAHRDSTNNYGDAGTILIDNSDFEIDPPILLTQSFDVGATNPEENDIFIADLQRIDRVNDNIHSSQTSAVSNVQNFNGNCRVFPA